MKYHEKNTFRDLSDGELLIITRLLGEKNYSHVEKSSKEWIYEPKDKKHKATLNILEKTLIFEYISEKDKEQNENLIKEIKESLKKPHHTYTPK